MGGFECSTHCRPNGTRLDLIAATSHDRFAESDYRRLHSLGLGTCRDGVRWHLIERRQGVYDFSTLLPQLRAARSAGMQVIWDLLHYGWPDGLGIFDPAFVDRFAKFARETARVIAQESEVQPFFVPVNEISFFSWAGAEVAIMPPFEKGRGYELKCQLVRAAIAAMEAIRAVMPGARFVHVDPLVNIVTDAAMQPETKLEAHRYCRAQFQAWDMLAGRVEPALGGGSQYIDILGGNYYVHNQWVYGGRFIERDDPRYRPLHDLLRELAARYGAPVFLAETGIEDGRRAEWLRYVCDEVAYAILSGVPVHGVCLYPVVNHPGWDDDRHCHNGLWDYCNDSGHREIYIPLAEELMRQQCRFSDLRSMGLHEPAPLHVSAQVR